MQLETDLELVARSNHSDYHETKETNLPLSQQKNELDHEYETHEWGVRMRSCFFRISLIEKLSISKAHRNILMILLFFIVSAIYLGFSISCTMLETEEDVRIVWIICIFWVLLFYYSVSNLIKINSDFMRKVQENFLRCKVSSKILSYKIFGSKILGSIVSKKYRAKLLKIFLYLLIAIFEITYIIIFVILPNPRRAISLAGILLFILIATVISKSPRHINWHTVYMGIFLQLILAILTMQTSTGHEIFRFIGDQIVYFTEFTIPPILLLFGEKYHEHIFIFKIMPILTMVSGTVGILIHFGIIDSIIRKPSRFIQIILGTTGPESINAVANIFLGMTEAPLISQNYLVEMTNSEIFALFANGLASIAGSMLAAFIAFGVPGNHLVIASVLSAPAALSIAKVIYPETRKSPTANMNELSAHISPYSSWIEAGITSANESLKLVAGIVTSMIIVLSLFSFADATLQWLGERLCLDYSLSINVMWPLTFMMGVSVEDCSIVSKLIAKKITVNEIVAYKELGSIIKNRQLMLNFTNGKLPYTYNISKIFTSNGDIDYKIVLGTDQLLLKGGFISDTSEIIATYALCGFANVTSVGILMGSLMQMAPSRRKDLSQMGLRALIAGNIACFLTACCAGLFYDQTVFD